MAQRLSALFILLGAAVCLWQFGIEAKALVQALLAKRWTTAVATISESKASIGCSRGSSYYPVVTYSYEYQGRSYHGSRITFGNPGCGGERAAQRIAASYPVGATVSVWVNPTAPSESALSVGNLSREAWLGLTFAPILGIGALWLARSMWRDSSAA